MKLQKPRMQVHKGEKKSHRCFPAKASLISSNAHIVSACGLAHFLSCNRTRRKGTGKKTQDRMTRAVVPPLLGPFNTSTTFAISVPDTQRCASSLIQRSCLGLKLSDYRRDLFPKGVPHNIEAKQEKSTALPHSFRCRGCTPETHVRTNFVS